MSTYPSFANRKLDAEHPSSCSCWKEAGCWGSSGWHLFAVEQPARQVTRCGPGGSTEEVLLPAYEVHIAYERCMPYWAAVASRREAARHQEPGLP